MPKPVDFATYQKMNAQAEAQAEDLMVRLTSVEDIRGCVIQPLNLKQDLHKSLYEVQKAVHKLRDDD